MDLDISVELALWIFQSTGYTSCLSCNSFCSLNILFHVQEIIFGWTECLHTC